MPWPITPDPLPTLRSACVPGGEAGRLTTVRMLIYTLQRIGLALLICVTSMCLLFGAIRMIPGDLATIMLGSRATQEMRDRLNHEMGLDQPVRGPARDLPRPCRDGRSRHRPVTQRGIGTVILENLPYTLTLIAAGLGWSALLGIPLGCYSAIRRNTFIDKLTGVISVGTISIPSFVVAIYALLIFAIELNWFPVIGAGEPRRSRRSALASRPAELRRRPGLGRLSRAHRPRLDAGGDGRASCPHRPGLRPDGAQDRPPLRPADRDPADDHPAGAGHRRPAVQRRLRREHLRPPRHRQADRRCRLCPQLPGGAGRRADTVALFAIAMPIADLLIAWLDPRVRAGL